MEVHERLQHLFTVMTGRGLEWVLLRVPSNLARPTGDVDILVAREHSGSLRETAEELGFVTIPGWEAAPNMLFACYDRPSESWLLLDVVTEIPFGAPRRRWPASVASEVLRRRRVHHGLASPAEEDEFWLLLLHCIFDKGSVPSIYRSRLQELTPRAAASPIVSSMLPAGARLWTPEDWRAEVISGRWSAVEEIGSRLAAELDRRRTLDHRVRELAARALATARKPLLLPRRRGVSVALVGPNGVGKSTVAAGIQRSFPLESRVIYMGLWKTAGGGGGRAAAEILLRPLRIWKKYAVAQYHKLRGRLVIFDRYVYEARLPTQPPLLALKRPYHWFLGRAIPPADSTAVLDVQGEVAYSRKQENPPDELERERRFYRELANDVPRLALVDASQDTDTVRADIMEIIWCCLAARWRKAPIRRALRPMAPVSPDEAPAR